MTNIFTKFVDAIISELGSKAIKIAIGQVEVD